MSAHGFGSTFQTVTDSEGADSGLTESPAP